MTCGRQCALRSIPCASSEWVKFVSDARNGVDVMSALVHEIRGAAGSVRLALSTLRDAGDDPALRRELIDSADGETQRLLRRLALVAPAAACIADTGAVERVEV